MIGMPQHRVLVEPESGWKDTSLGVTYEKCVSENGAPVVKGRATQNFCFTALLRSASACVGALAYSTSIPNGHVLLRSVAELCHAINAAAIVSERESILLTCSCPGVPLHLIWLLEATASVAMQLSPLCQ